MRYFAVRVLKVGLTAAWVCVMLTQCSAAVLEEDKIPLADYTEDPPFATIADFAAGDYALQSYASSNMVRVWSDWLAPVNFAWDELAAVTRPDGTQLESSLSVDYHEARFPQLAKRLAEEYRRIDCRKTITARNDRYEKLSLPELDVDEAAGYRDSLGYPTIVAAQGHNGDPRAILPNLVQQFYHGTGRVGRNFGEQPEQQPLTFSCRKELAGEGSLLKGLPSPAKPVMKNTRYVRQSHQG